MLKTCAICGRIHSPVCTRKRDVKGIDKFRWSSVWKAKAAEIKDKHRHLCACCIREKYETVVKYNCIDIDVHHIIPLADNYDLRLNDDNLVPLCRQHHKMADDGRISREVQRKWTVPYRELMPPGEG